MKNGTRFLGMVAALVLLVAVTALYISGGFQMLWDEFDLLEGAGFNVVFIPVAAGFAISIRRQGCSIQCGCPIGTGPAQKTYSPSPPYRNRSVLRTGTNG